MRPVVWSQAASDDYDSILAFIARDSVVHARSVADRIEATCDLLGTLATGRAGRVAGTYEKPVPNLPYTIAYVVEIRHHGAEQITIIRVIHDARNWTPDTWPQ